MEWDKEAAKASEAKAENDLQLLKGKMTAEQWAGAVKLVNWMRKWYNGNTETNEKSGTVTTNHATGWKALARIAHAIVK